MRAQGVASGPEPLAAGQTSPLTPKNERQLFSRVWTCGHRAEVSPLGVSGLEWCYACRAWVGTIVTALDDDGKAIDLFSSVASLR